MHTYCILVQRTDGKVLNYFVQGDAVVGPSGTLAIYQEGLDRQRYLIKRRPR